MTLLDISLEKILSIKFDVESETLIVGVLEAVDGR